MKPEQVLQESREEFKKRFGNPTAKYMGNDFAEYPKANIHDALNFIDATLQSFLDAERQRVLGILTDIFDEELESNSGDPQYYKRIHAFKEETIKHLKGLKK